MKHISEINHCIPNSRAYWCGKCQCHSQYTVKSSGSSDSYLCLHCRSRQFRPKDVTPWMYGLLGFTLLTVVIAILWGIHLYMAAIPPLFFLEEFVERGGFLGMAGFAVSTGLIGLMMRKSLREWNAWCGEQRWKSSSELKTEACQHPHQPVHGDAETYFDEWAGQFLSEDQVRELNLKYGSQPASEDTLLFPD
jgi:hypothetical protein